MSKIKELPKSSSHLLQCTQIITSVQSVVKELIENALDSCSKNIEIKLDDYGLEKIEVKDSGSGICKDDIDKVCKPHCTSKISSHADLNQIQTYGFRGEALAAICAVSDLSITTKTADEQFGFTYIIGKNGEIASSKPYPCTQGTTVAASNLFKNIPVRRQYYRPDKNRKDELKKIEDILCAFGCIHSDIRFALFHNKSLIWQKPVVNKIREGLMSVFGNSIVEHLQNCEFFDEKEKIKIEVFLPKENAPSFCSNTSSNRSIISINKRPVRMKEIDKVLKQCFSKSLINISKARYPTSYISIEVPPSQTDVNVEPNKTTVMLHNMNIVTEQLTALLKTFYDNDPSNANNASAVKTPEDTTKVKLISLEAPMKQSEIKIVSSPAENQAHTTKFPNNKVKCFEKKNLCRPSDSQEPTVKKMKTSSSTNDIYRHIKTMDSYFASVNSIDNENTNNNSTLLSNVNESLKVTPVQLLPNSVVPANTSIQSEIPVTLQSTISDTICDINSPENYLNKIQQSNADKNSTRVTVERKQLSFLPHDNEKAYCNNNSFNDINLPENNLSNIQPPNADKNCTVVTVERKQFPDDNESAYCNNNSFNDINLPENNLSNIQPPNADKNCTVVTVERKQFPDDNESEYFSNNLLNTVDLNKRNEPRETNIDCLINDASLFNLFDLDETISKQLASDILNAPINDNNNCASDINDDLNFHTAKMILEKNKNILVDDDPVPLANKISNNSDASTPKKTNETENHLSSNFTESQNWSRGKHPTGDLQPVAVLMPQRVENCSKDVNKKLTLKGKTSPKELNSVISNQRKLTAFDIFCRKHRLEIASLNPEMNNHQIAQILTEKWNNLSVEEKSIYKNMIDKPYPKTVKNKEKLQISVKENLNKTKGTPTKRRLKTKKKYVERIVPFDLQPTSRCNSSFNIDDTNVISCLAPGVWMYSQNKKLYILNTFRLQEMIIYHRLLKTYRFEPEQLEFPCIVSNDTLGEEAVTVISQLPKKECYLAESIIDERITANGFKINLLKSQGETQIQVVGMTGSIAFYSVMDLKEILLHLKEKGSSATLSECRPGKIILYLQSEAVRMARQFPASKSIEDVEELLKSKENLPLTCDSCIHSKPFVHEIASLS